jgi:O-succinylbenzoate synthase
LKVAAVELFRVEMPLVAAFRTRSGTETVRDALLLRVEGAAGEEGWGECVASTEPRYSAEFNDAVLLVLRDLLVPRLLAAPDPTGAGTAALFAEFRGHRMAKAALEMAMLDAELRAGGVSFARHLGGVRRSVEVGVAVGIAPSVPQLLDIVGRHLEEGYRRVKLKIEPGWDLEPVGAVRERFGPDVLLQVDANGAYTRADLDHLRRLDEHGLLLVEQPFDEEDLLAHAELARSATTPVCLDESIPSAAAAATAVALGACSVVNVKAGRVGGYLEALRVHDVCAAHGVPVWCGGMLETGIGRAANLALASLPNFRLPADISATDRYYRNDVTRRFVLQEGAIAVPEGPGLGIEVDRDALAAVTVQRERWSR